MKYRIAANSLSWVIQKQITNKGKSKWVGDKWYGTAEQLGKALIDMKARSYVSLGQDIVSSIQKAYSEVTEMLQTKTITFDVAFRLAEEGEENEE